MPALPLPTHHILTRLLSHEANEVPWFLVLRPTDRNHSKTIDKALARLLEIKHLDVNLCAVLDSVAYFLQYAFVVDGVSSG